MRTVKLAVSLLLSAALFLPISASADTLTGTIVSISDGDTIFVQTDKGRQRIEIAGIDAPEMGQPFGKQSRDHLVSVAKGKKVSVIWQAKTSGGTIIGRVQLDTGEDVAFVQLASGMARHSLRGDLSPGDQSLYEQTEMMTKTASMGMWGDDTAADTVKTSTQ